MLVDMDEEPIITSSAHREEKHSELPIDDADILHAYAHGEPIGMNTGRHPPTFIVVGPGRDGITLYEIGYFKARDPPLEGRILIVHAMRARQGYAKKYLQILRGEYL
ncbi:MAG: hypothetical protein LKJ05_06910 [Bifidobacteriaceae bacterium]|jgi:hypothetical protein|nr:hypothetical protein [Bifidobacteriaceae bacterium]